MSIVVLDVSVYRNPRLEALIDQYQPCSAIQLDKQQLTDADIKIVVQQAIVGKRCRSLSLAFNGLTAKGASYLADALCNNTTLHELWLYNNHVSDAGVHYLAKALTVNKTLQKIGLAANDITNAGVPPLVEMVKKNSTLSMLGLAMNKIGDHGVQMLTNALAQQNTSIEVLALDRNELVGDSSVDPLIHMIKCNRSMKELWINGCSLSAKGQKKLQAAAESKKNFKVMTMYEKSS